jgi:hypothetical protein
LSVFHSSPLSGRVVIFFDALIVGGQKESKLAAERIFEATLRARAMEGQVPLTIVHGTVSSLKNPCQSQSGLEETHQNTEMIASICQDFESILSDNVRLSTLTFLLPLIFFLDQVSAQPVVVSRTKDLFELRAFSAEQVTLTSGIFPYSS